MPRPSKTEIRTLPELADSYRWNMEVPVQNNIPGWPTEAALNLRCVSATMPSRTMTGQVDIQIRGHHIMRPGPMDEQHTINLIFVEDVENTISLWLKNWRDAIYNADTGERQDDYAVDGIKLIRLDHLDGRIWEYELFGCYLQEFDPGGDLGADAGQGVQPNITLYYDTFKDGPEGNTSYGPTA